MTYMHNNYAMIFIGFLLLVALLKFVFVIYRLSHDFKTYLDQEENERLKKQRQKEAKRRERQEAFAHRKQEHKATQPKPQNLHCLPSLSVSRFAKDFEFYKHCSDPYAIIGCTISTSSEQMKKSYQNLVKKWHPDIITAMNVTKEDMKKATQIMQIINNAYEEVSRRKAA